MKIIDHQHCSATIYLTKKWQAQERLAIATDLGILSGTDYMSIAHQVPVTLVQF